MQGHPVGRFATPQHPTGTDEPLLHQHDILGTGETCYQCATAAHFSHTKAAECWEKTLGTVFKNYLSLVIEADKPRILPLRKKYIKTDGKTVLAYFLMTASFSTFRGSMKYITIRKQRDGIVLAHLDSRSSSTSTRSHQARPGHDPQRMAPVLSKDIHVNRRAPFGQPHHRRRLCLTPRLDCVPWPWQCAADSGVHTAGHGSYFSASNKPCAFRCEKPFSTRWGSNKDVGEVIEQIDDLFGGNGVTVEYMMPWKLTREELLS